MNGSATREVIPVHQGLQCVVAIDGPSGTGKSTVARRLAVAFRARYLDTGAMYRAAALGVLRAGVDPHDRRAVGEVVARLRVEVGTDPERPTVLLDGADVSDEIRGPAVTAAVSPVSATPEVRRLLVAQQRRIIAQTAGEGAAGEGAAGGGPGAAGGGGIVVEGRDIGTVVAPDAPLKVFLTAAVDQRALRRAAQDGTDDVATVRRAVQRRDHYDSTRDESPLRAADDAVELDTTTLDIGGVLDRLHELLLARGLVAVPVRGHR